VGVQKEVVTDRKLRAAKSINCEEIKRKEPEYQVLCDNPVKLLAKSEDKSLRAEELPMSYELPKEIEDIKKMIRESYRCQ
jgi:hypothetical protein